MIGIIVALESEAKTFISLIKNRKDFSILGKKAYSGKVENKEIVLILSGVGKVNAALTTQYIIDNYSPEYILNFGTAGGTNNDVNILEYYLIEKSSQFDFDLSQLDNVPIGYIQDYDTTHFENYTLGIDLPKRNLATSDRFNDDPKDVVTIRNLSCSIRDMEGGAIGEVCTANKIKLVMVKGITDVYGSTKTTDQFLQNLSKVSQGFSDIIPKVISQLK